MARKALVVKQQKALTSFLLAKKEGRTPKEATRVYNRCSLCGRSHGYLRDFGICRCCFREFAEKAQIPGLRKSSW